jgi:hypothetical protein
MMLGELELRDICLNKSDARAAARKWFWQAQRQPEAAVRRLRCFDH